MLLTLMYRSYFSIIVRGVYQCGVWDVYFYGTVEYIQVWNMGCLLWNKTKFGVWDVYFCATVEYIQVWCMGYLLLLYCGTDMEKTNSMNSVGLDFF